MAAHKRKSEEKRVTIEKRKTGTAKPKPTENQCPREEKSTKKPTKNTKISTKNRFRPLSGAPGRSGSLLDRAGTLLGRSPEAKWKRLGGQAGRLGRHVGHRGRQVGSPRRSKRRPGPAQSPLRTRAQSRTAFVSIFRCFSYALVERPNLNFRQPVQCCVHFLSLIHI